MLALRQSIIILHSQINSLDIMRQDKIQAFMRGFDMIIKIKLRHIILLILIHKFVPINSKTNNN